MHTNLKLLLILSLCSISARAALPNFTTVWEVESGGNDVNGAGFVTGSSGTDMSQFPNKNAASCTSCQSATINISTTDAVCAGTTTLTSVTANFSAAIVGNIIHLNGGSGSLTAVWKEVTVFTSSTTVTIDSSCATGTGITMNIGGALATPNQAALNMALTDGAGAWIKAATYSITTNIVPGFGGANGGVPFFTGYQTSRGDLQTSNCFTATCPIFQAAAGLGGADNAILRFVSSPTGVIASNLILDCNNQSHTSGLRFASTWESVYNMWAENCSDSAIDVESLGEVCDRCTTTNSPAAGIAGGSPSVSAVHIAGGGSIELTNSALLGSTVNSAIALNGACYGTYHDVTISSFTGTTADAVQCATMEGVTQLLNFSIYNVTRHAFHFSRTATVDQRSLLIRNAVISKIGGYCFIEDGTLTVRSQFNENDHNFCDTTTLGPGGGSPLGFYNGFPAGPGDVTLTAGPFTLPGSNNFALNGTAGGGAAVKGLGFPGVISSGTGSTDGGTIQSAGSSATTHGYGTR